DISASIPVNIKRPIEPQSQTLSQSTLTKRVHCLHTALAMTRYSRPAGSCSTKKKPRQPGGVCTTIWRGPRSRACVAYYVVFSLPAMKGRVRHLYRLKSPTWHKP